MSSTLAAQLRHLGERSIVRALRDPVSVAPGLVIPLVLFGVVSAGLRPVTRIPGFPTPSYTSFTLTVAFALGAMLAITSTGQALATDIETGFISRLALTPMRGTALLASQLAGTLALGLLQATVYLGVGFAVGARVEAGVPGVLVLVALFLASAAAFGALGMFIALRTGSNQAVQGTAPLALVFIFLSSIALPRDLIGSDWFRTVATYNPVSYIVEGMRSVLVTGWDGEAVALGFAVPAVLGALMLAASAVMLRGRLVRT
jgi:ABC-2 type transport system permease protein